MAELQTAFAREAVSSQIKQISSVMNRSLSSIDHLDKHLASKTGIQNISPSFTSLKIQYSTSTQIMLPLELIDSIMTLLEPQHLVVALQCSKSMYASAVRVLYKDITLDSPRCSIICLRTLSSSFFPRSYLNHPYHSLVRTLKLDWCSPSCRDMNGTRNLYQLLHNALKRLIFLTSLSIDLPEADNALWTLQNPSFALESFGSAFPCDSQLAEFLDTQPSIKALTLRGFSSANEPFSFMEGFQDTRAQPFPLLPTSLPYLSTFSAVHAGPEVLTKVLNGIRPIKQTSVPIYTGRMKSTLEAVKGCQNTLERLSVTCFDSAMLIRNLREGEENYGPEKLLQEVAERFPELEALHLVVLLTTCSANTLRIATGSMSKFTRLQYVTFMAAVSDDAMIDEKYEREIATTWHELCPTLRTIILPRGKVWFREREEEEERETWACLKDEYEEEEGSEEDNKDDGAEDSE